MKRFIIFMVVASLFISVQSFAVQSATQTVTIRLISQVEVMKTKTVKGLFEGLTAQASEIGLSEAITHGKLSYQNLPNKSVRVKIQWHSLGMDTGGATEPLSLPLWSQFTVKDKKIEPGTEVTAKGDLEGVTKSYLALKEKQKSDTPRHLVDSKETTKSTSETKLADNGIAPSSGGSSAGGSSAPVDSTSTNDSSVSTDLITTAWESCQPRIDSVNGVLNLQWRRTETNQDGVITDQGSCLDTGETVAGVRNYSNCSVFIDIGSMKVFEKYSLAATVDGVDYSIADCTLDLDRFSHIQATQNQCGMRHDFNTGQSVQQERLFYTDATGESFDVSLCQDTTEAYAHFLTEQTCNPTIDPVANVVFINKRTAYRLNDGTMEFANDCRPVDQTGIPVLEEYCSPKYEHDFVNNVSYYSTRNYYLDEAGATKYISACSRSATASFSHIFQTSGCDLTHDDILLQSTQQSKTEIHTVDDGVIELVACQDQGQPTSYAYLRQDQTVQPDFTMVLEAGTGPWEGTACFNCITEYTIEGLARPGIMWTNANTNIDGIFANSPQYEDTSIVWGDQTVYPREYGAFFVNTNNTAYRAPSTITGYQTAWRVGKNNPANQVRSTLAETTIFTVYMRGDSTEFWKETGSKINFTIRAY